MSEQTGNIESKDYALEVPFAPFSKGSFHVKGAENYDWGMKDRLSRIFSPKSGNTVMLAFDHGYIMGSTSGLERLDISIPPLIPEVDVLMGTRGAIRTCVPPSCNKAIALRCSAGSSVLDDDMSHEHIAVDIEDAIRLNASCLAVQTFIGSPGQASSIKNLCNAIDAGNRFGIPTLGVVAVGKQMERTAKFFLLSTRMLAEFGAHIIKTYYCEDFEKIVAACPVPIVIAGGKKLPEKDALEMAYNAMIRGARGVDMGRNIFQSECPSAMTKSISKIVHDQFDAVTAYEYYIELKKRR